MKQYTFTSEEELINEVDEIAARENRTRSVTIKLLLQLAVKEKNRKRKNGKEVHVQHQPSN